MPAAGRKGSSPGAQKSKRKSSKNKNATANKKKRVRIAGELQRWNWMFLRLWEFCGPVNPACILNIPDTVLFKSAQPSMWLWTHPSGRIERREFEFKIKAGETRSPADEKMRLIRERFLEIRPERLAGGGGHFCVAWYRDGTTEHLDLHAFTRLQKHKQWRASLFGLQAYIAPKVSSMGLYSVYDDDTGADLVQPGKDGQPGPPLRRNAALDMLCKKLALHLEAACKSYPLRKLIRVYRLVGSFIISAGDEKLYLVFAPELRAQPLQETFATQAEIEAEVFKITVAINNIVHVAQKRGMKMQQVFRYFDQKAEGHVSREQFIENLVPLGIEVEEVHQLSLLRKIGLNNDGFIGFREFKKFIKTTRKNIAAHETEQLRLTGGGGGSGSARFLAGGDSQATPDSVSGRRELNSAGDVATGPLGRSSSSSLADVRSAARLESADGPRNRTKPRAAAGPGTLRSLEDGGVGSMDRGNAVQPTPEAEESKLTPWARESAHDTLAEMERRSKQKATLLSTQAARGVRDRGTEAAADTFSLEPSSLTTGTILIADGVEIGYYSMPQPADAEYLSEAKTSDDLANPSGAHVQAVAKAAELRGLKRRAGLAFRLLVLADFFQNLESLHDFLLPLAQQFRDASIVVANFPGQLGAICAPSRKKVVLNNKYLAKCTAILMRHLTEPASGRLWATHELDEAPVFVLGFGNGGSVASYLVANLDELSDVEAMQAAQSTTDAENSKNGPPAKKPKSSDDGRLLSAQLRHSLEGVVLVNPLVHVDKARRQLLQRLLKMPEVASRQERVQHLCSLLFSQSHLDSKGKSAALASFFEALHGWSPDAELDEGVELLVRGALRHSDVRRCYTANNTPAVKHLLVASTEDDFFPATQSNELIEALGGGRVMEPSVEACCARKGEFAAHVAWFKSGHCIDQERPSVLLHLLANFFEQATENSKPSMHADKPPPGLMDGFVDDGTPGARARFLRAKRKAMLVAAQNGGVGYSSEGGLPPQYLQRAGTGSTGDDAALSQRRSTDDAFSEKLLEMQLQQAAFIERDLEREEGLLMAVEDERSQAHRLFLEAQAKWAAEAEGTRAEVAKFQKLRDETQARKELEASQLAKAEVREESRLRKEQRKKEMKEKSFALHDIDLEGQELGYGLDSSDPVTTVEGSRRLRHDMDLVRSRKARALRKQIPIVEQQARMRATERSLTKMLDDVVRARVLAVKDKKSGNLEGEKLKALEVELSYLKVKEIELNPKLAKLQAHLRQVSEEADYLTSVVQQVIIVQRNLFTTMEQLLSKLQSDYDLLHRAKSQIIRDAEDSTERSYQLTKLVGQTRKRHLKLTEELERCAMWRKEWIDSDAYQDGVPQRIRKKQLVKFCKKEIVVVAQKIQKYEQDLEDCTKAKTDVEARLASFADNLVAFQEEARKLKENYEVAKAEQTKEQLAQADAEDLANRKNDAAAEMAARHAAVNAMMGLTNLASQCRVKPADERSTEERNFVALDVLLHPELYMHINDEDREVMEVDEAYHTSVTQAGVRRIATLPAELNLAMPHLYSDDEVKAHVLIQKFEHAQGQEDLRKADCEVDLTRAARKVQRQLMAQAIRAKLPEERSEEEQEWVSIDKLLRPHLYPYEDESPCLVDPELEAQDIVKIASTWRAGLERDAHRRVWDLVYQYAEIGDCEGEEPLPPFPTEIVSRLSQVPDKVTIGPVLVHTGTQLTILHTEQNELAMRERHVHEFRIDSDGHRLPRNVRVNIVFKGVFDVRGYNLGRISAALFFKPESGGAIACGHAPLDLLSLCKPTQFGRLCIVHQPQVAPLATGDYELVVIGCSKTVYSVHVDCEILQPVRDAIEAVVKASDHAPRIDKIKGQIMEIKTTIRIGQRKLRLASALLRQAETKFDKLSKHRFKFNAQLTDPEAHYKMNNAERRKVETTVAALDRAMGDTSEVVKLRLDEVESIRGPLADLLNTQRRFEADLLRLERELLAIRESIPPVTAAITGVALPILVGEARDFRTINSLKIPAWAKRALLETMPYLKTPAHVTRSKSQEQWTATEREWRKLDYILRPEKNQDLDASSMLGLANLPPYSQHDLQMLLVRPVRDLSDQEKYDRDLLLQFHDRIPSTKFQSKVLSARKFGKLWKKKAGERKKQRNQMPGAAPERVRVEVDVDARARELMHDLDRAKLCKKDDIDSHVLHGSTQRFPTLVLRQQLNIALDQLLISQIRERERAVTDMREEKDDVVELKVDEAVSRVSHFAGIGRVNIKDRRRKLAKAAVQQVMDRHEQKHAEGDGSTSTDIVATSSNLRQADTFRPVQDVDTADSASEDARRSIVPTSSTKATSQDPSTLPPYKPYLDYELIKDRLRELEEELELVRCSSAEYVVSNVPESVQLGGTNRFYRKDLQQTLHREALRVRMELRLHECDRELYLAYGCETDFFETTALHGYAQLQRREGAIVALERESVTLVGKTVALEIVDRILDTMLDGWYFGERESDFAVAGFVPSIKREGKITPFDPPSVHETKPFRTKEQRKAHRRRGLLKNKQAPIPQRVNHEVALRKAIRVGSDTEHVLNETERNIKFGLFVITLMFFQSSSMLKREQNTWGGVSDPLKGSRSKGKALDRNKQNEEQKRQKRQNDNIAKRERLAAQANGFAAEGQARKDARAKAERDKRLAKLRDASRLRNAQVKAALTIQAGYRGFMDRKVSKAYAIERAAEVAQHALEKAASINVQRFWRGYVAREIAGDRREELLLFLEALKREEAKTMEEEYYKLHPMELLKKQMREGMKKAQEDPDSLVSKLNLPNWFDKQYDPKRDGRSRAGSEGDDRGENTYDSDDDAEAAISGDSVDDNGSLNEPRPLGDDDAYSDEEGPEQEAEEEIEDEEDGTGRRTRLERRLKSAGISSGLDTDDEF